jgi:pyruvate/2-oxoglutarate dehydrogenase complex dihydrolipoamide acyltransferase (E2) component
VAHAFTLPELGEGLTEGEIARWLVREGDTVAENEVILEIQTDKATVELGSPVAGVVLRILAEDGEIAPVGATLALIGAPGEQLLRSVAMPKYQAPEPVEPIVAVVGSEPLEALTLHRLARELSVDFASLQGTGPGGRVTEADVRAAAGDGDGRAEAEGRREPLRGVRRRIAEHMARAHREVPPVTWVEECDFGRVDLKLLVPTVLRACALSLKEFPELNARLEGDDVVYLERYDLGVAVQTEQGLVVPVVRGCDERSVEELGSEVERLAEAARDGKLKPEELRGSTFTVTSAGKLGGLLQTPIVNHPEVAILSIGRIALRPVVRDGEIVAAQIGYIAITFDHRVVDGARAAQFGLDVIGRLEA